MTDKPIIFSAPMVRALLDGRKTQTRRVIKAAPPEATSAGTYYSSETGHSNVCTWLSGDPSDCDTWGVLDDFRLPYAPGDRLYVREALALDGCPEPKNRYQADDAPLRWATRDQAVWLSEYARAVAPSIHMPRWASRLTLTVTEVRVQRLQEITGRDIISEGVRCEGCHNVGTGNYSACRDGGCFAGRNDFRDLWNSLHGPEAWAENPWVVALTFTVQHGNIDQVAA